MALLCPILQEQQFTDNGEFLVGGLMWFYEAGTSTLANSYTTEDGDVAWSNPIVLNSRGETGGTIWLDDNKSYRIVVEGKPYYGQTHGTVITEHDNIAGIPVAVEAEPWITFSGVPTYISSTSFTVANDYRDIFVIHRKILCTDSGGTSMHSVASSTFWSGVTTVNVTGIIDSGLSSVQYSFITPESSPDRFIYLATDDIDVADDVTVGGDITIAGNINSVAATSYWNNTNNIFSFNAGNLVAGFHNTLRVYTYTFTVPNGSGASVSGTHTFPVAFPTACTQVIACFGINDNATSYAGDIRISSITTTGFNWTAAFYTPANYLQFSIRYIAIGY